MYFGKRTLSQVAGFSEKLNGGLSNGIIESLTSDLTPA